MKILIANIGTSDLAIKMEVNGKEYYLPIDPLNEPNQDKSALTDEEINIWEKPQNYFQVSGLYAKLGFSPQERPSSRELTKKLLEYYQQNPDYWHSRIFPPRIMGVLAQAKRMGINQAYIFVTNQTPIQKRPQVRDKDTTYLYQILQLWFQKELPDFTLIPEYIPEDIPLIDDDLLFKFYFQFFNKLRFEKEQLQQQRKFLQVGDILSGRVVDFDKQNQGIFVEVESGKRGFVHISNISHEPVNPDEIRNIFQLGNSICVKFIKSDGGKLKFSSKELESTPGEMLSHPQAVYEQIKTQLTQNSLSDAENQEELMLISVKGGTIQMKTALQLQGISVAAVNRLLFVNPKLEIPRVFAGLPSSCELESYWRYIRTQKYQTVRLLLGRWDFDGAIQVLQDWQVYLEYLISKEIVEQAEIERSNNLAKLVITALNFGRTCLNLDFQTANDFVEQGQKICLQHSELNSDDLQKLWRQLSIYIKDYEYSQQRLLNLYTQNRIYWQLDQLASFLSHISSFYEETLRELIIRWVGKADYLQPEKFDIDVRRLKRFNVTIWDNFAALEKQGNPRFRFSEDKYRLTSRYSKRNFAEALAKFRNDASESHAWNELCSLLKQLDFWSDKRNQLIHGAKGFSKQLMRELYINHDLQESPACSPDEILDIMSTILKNNLVNLKTVYRNEFIGDDAPYYIYTTVSKWVIQQLIDDGTQ